MFLEKYPHILYLRKSKSITYKLLIKISLKYILFTLASFKVYFQQKSYLTVEIIIFIYK